MLPRSIPCEECGKTALVRGYGRVEYDWNADGGSHEPADATALTIRSIRLTIDCPHCGLRVQEHYPNGTDQRARSLQPEKLRQATHTFASLLTRSTQPGLPEIHR